VTQSPPRAIDIKGYFMDSSPGFVRLWELGVAYLIFAPDGSHFFGPGENALALWEAGALDRRLIVGNSVRPIDRPEFAPDGRTLAVLHPAPFLEIWKQGVNRLYTSLSRPPRYDAEPRSELAFFDARSGAVRGRIGDLPAGTCLIGFGPDGRTVWTFRHTPAAAAPAATVPAPGPNLPPLVQVSTTGDGTLRVQEWAVPPPWPPAWLLAVTALGLLLAIGDRWRARRVLLLAPNEAVRHG
jgi:hypothetical protein